MSHYLHRTANKNLLQNCCNIRVTYFKHDIFSIPNKFLFFEIQISLQTIEAILIGSSLWLFAACSV